MLFSTFYGLLFAWGAVTSAECFEDLLVEGAWREAPLGIALGQLVERRADLKATQPARLQLMNPPHVP
jgi:hypothetical protein